MKHKRHEQLTQKTNPSLQLTWENDTNGKLATLVVRQLQNTEAYSFPLSMDLINGSGEKKRVKIDVTKTEQIFVLPTNGAIDSIIVDPDTELLIDKLIVAQKG